MSVKIDESVVELQTDADVNGKKGGDGDLGDTMSIGSTGSDTYEEKLIHGSGMLGTTMNMTNTIIGSGILSLPFSTSQVGWVLAAVLMFFGATFTWFGLHLLSAVADSVGGRQTSFGGSANVTYPWLVLVADLLVFFTMWAVCVVYMTIAAGLLPDVIRQFIDEDSESSPVYLEFWFWLLLCWLLAGSLSMLKSLWFLAYTSLVAVGCVFWTTFVVFAYSVGIFDPCDGIAEPCKGNTEAFIWDFQAIMRAFPVFVLAFCCGPVMFNIYNAMAEQSAKRMDIAAMATMMLTTSLYLIISFCGYFTYGNLVNSNILMSYPISVVASLARLGTAFVVTVSYPLLMHAARDSLIHAIGTCMGYAGKKEQGFEFTDTNTKLGNIGFYCTATALNLLAFLFAYFNIDINILLSITGAIGNVNLSFTIPGILYYKMFEENGWSMTRTLCVPFTIFGLVTTGISLWANFA
ncbi:hypothetical protein SARC_10351 [Sphaeroforma arctica JP610]|uniref:Amino acid transporter transmembrane domain-containing protein n=1 Tax=Sphaeroforma arctica JP610 TaxID=667725 RepID=A0A0L0FK82_9EUKA|nr:hypothetical protein SARC_10351 [Sphaeroforma arctica JP610]KNC77179.1 hypothetical protein SARC_10351 [Sphaeroforma arctica JP610]|eukprot:XP_014151081.1 hypothetical protein SARC_10351 [Sphaeroforma arctica JP610]